MILVLTGTDQRGLNWAWDVILDSKMRDQFIGNLMVVGSDKRTASPSEQANQKPEPNFQQTAIVINLPIIGKFLQRNGSLGAVTPLAAILGAGAALVIALKVFSIAASYEIRKKPQTQALEEQE
jgi:hypothetical protein